MPFEFDAATMTVRNTDTGETRPMTAHERLTATARAVGNVTQAAPTGQYFQESYGFAFSEAGDNENYRLGIENGLYSSGMSRASTPNSLLRGVMLNRGYTLSELMDPDAFASERAALGQEILTAFQTPEGAARVVAEAAKGYSNICLQNEMIQMFGEEAGTDAGRRQLLQNEENRVRMYNFLFTFQNNMREISQTVSGMCDSAGNGVFVPMDASQSPRPIFGAFMSEMDADALRLRSAAANIANVLGAGGGLPRMLSEYYLSRDFDDTLAPDTASQGGYDRGNMSLPRAAVGAIVMNEIMEHLLAGAEDTLGQTPMPPFNYYSAKMQQGTEALAGMAAYVLKEIVRGDPEVIETFAPRIFDPDTHMQEMRDAAEQRLDAERGLAVLDAANRDAYRRSYLPENARDEAYLTQMREKDEHRPMHPFVMTPEQQQARHSELDGERVRLQNALQAAGNLLQNRQQRLTQRGEADALETGRIEAARRYIARTERDLVRTVLQLDATDTARNAGEALLAHGVPNFQLTPVFSPQLKEALGRMREASDAAVSAGTETAALLGHTQSELDLRDFTEMAPYPLGATPEEAARITSEYTRLFFGTPAERKEALDMFYDRMDAVDVFSLDLSVLEGRDDGPRLPPDNLTRSERDVLSFVRLVRANQAIMTKMGENPGYFEARYPTPEARLRFDLMQNMLVSHGFNLYFSNGVLPSNGIRQNLMSVPGFSREAFDAQLRAGEVPVGLLPAIPMAAQISMQTYRVHRAALEGVRLPPEEMAFRFTVPAGEAARQMYESMLGGSNRDNDYPRARNFIDTIDLALRSDVAQQYMRDTGAEMEDLIFIDGRSLRELYGEQTAGFEPRRRTRALQQMAFDAMVSGEYRVELGLVTTDHTGAYSVRVCPMQPDLRALEPYERRYEHGAARRAFDFGATKIETRASKADALWQNDPDREARHAAISNSVAQRIFTRPNLESAMQARSRANEEAFIKSARGLVEAAPPAAVSDLSAARTVADKALREAQAQKEQILRERGLLEQQQERAQQFLDVQRRTNRLLKQAADPKSEINWPDVSKLYEEFPFDFDAVVRFETARMGEKVVRPALFRHQALEQLLDVHRRGAPEAERRELLDQAVSGGRITKEERTRFEEALKLPAAEADALLATLKGELNTAVAEYAGAYKAALDRWPHRELANPEAMAGRKAGIEVLSAQLVQVPDEVYRRAAEAEALEQDGIEVHGGTVKPLLNEWRPEPASFLPPETREEALQRIVEIDKTFELHKRYMQDASIVASAKMLFISGIDETMPVHEIRQDIRDTLAHIERLNISVEHLPQAMQQEYARHMETLRQFADQHIDAPGPVDYDPLQHAVTAAGRILDETVTMQPQYALFARDRQNAISTYDTGMHERYHLMQALRGFGKEERLTQMAAERGTAYTPEEPKHAFALSAAQLEARGHETRRTANRLVSQVLNAQGYQADRAEELREAGTQLLDGLRGAIARETDELEAVSGLFARASAAQFEAARAGLLREQQALEALSETYDIAGQVTQQEKVAQAEQRLAALEAHTLTHEALQGLDGAEQLRIAREFLAYQQEAAAPGTAGERAQNAEAAQNYIDQLLRVQQMEHFADVLREPQGISTAERLQLAKAYADLEARVLSDTPESDADARLIQKDRAEAAGRFANRVNTFARHERHIEELQAEQQRLERQQDVVRVAASLSENAVGREAPVGLLSAPQLSPQLLAAIKNRADLRTAAGTAARAAATELGHEHNRDSNDTRDFTEMVTIDMGATPEEAAIAGEQYARLYYSGPEGRKAALDMFYDKVDTFDPMALDYSCLQGKDTGARTGPDQLTQSERDMLRLMEAVRYNQTIGTKAKENPGYLEARYNTPEALQRYDMINYGVIMNSMNTYITMCVLVANSLDNDWSPMREQALAIRDESIMHEMTMSAEVSLQHYKQVMASMAGEKTDPTIHATMPAPTAGKMYEAIREPHSWKGSGMFDASIGALFTNDGTKRLMRENGLEMQDMIFIDGKSMRELYDERRAAPSKDRIKQDAFQLLVSGDRRVEIGMLQPDANGVLSVRVSPVRLNLHAMDELEKRNEHNAARRALDFGAAKIGTRADKMDALWQDDPEREARQRAVQESVAKRVFAHANLESAMQARSRANEAAFIKGAHAQEEDAPPAVVSDLSAVRTAADEALRVPLAQNEQIQRERGILQQQQERAQQYIDAQQRTDRMIAQAADPASALLWRDIERLTENLPFDFDIAARETLERMRNNEVKPAYKRHEVYETYLEKRLDLNVPEAERRAVLDKAVRAGSITAADRDRFVAAEDPVAAVDLSEQLKAELHDCVGRYAGTYKTALDRWPLRDLAAPEAMTAREAEIEAMGDRVVQVPDELYIRAIEAEAREKDGIEVHGGTIEPVTPEWWMDPHNYLPPETREEALQRILEIDKSIELQKRYVKDMAVIASAKNIFALGIDGKLPVHENRQDLRDTLAYIEGAKVSLDHLPKTMQQEYAENIQMLHSFADETLDAKTPYDSIALSAALSKTFRVLTEAVNLRPEYFAFSKDSQTTVAGYDNAMRERYHLMQALRSFGKEERLNQMAAERGVTYVPAAPVHAFGLPEAEHEAYARECSNRSLGTRMQLENAQNAHAIRTSQIEAGGTALLGSVSEAVARETDELEAVSGLFVSAAAAQAEALLAGLEAGPLTQDALQALDGAEQLRIAREFLAFQQDEAAPGSAEVRAQNAEAAQNYIDQLLRVQQLERFAEVLQEPKGVSAAERQQLAGAYAETERRALSNAPETDVAAQVILQDKVEAAERYAHQAGIFSRYDRHLEELHAMHQQALRRENVEHVAASLGKNAAEREAPAAFLADPIFSPQLMAAIKKRAELRVAAGTAARATATELGHEHKRSTNDTRDFAEMVTIDMGATPEEAAIAGEQYARLYYSGPEGRKAALDMFYDKVDTFDPMALDYSCLQGKDTGARTGPDQLTQSERDMLRLMEAVRYNQTIGTKAKENHGYLEARYNTPEAKRCFELINYGVVSNFNSYLASYALSANGLNESWGQIDALTMRNRDAMLMPNTLLQVESALQHYKQSMAAKSGKTLDPTVRVTVPQAAAAALYGTVRDPEGYEAGNMFHALIGTAFSNRAARDLMEENGLEMQDMVFIDGKSMREFYADKFADTPATADTRMQRDALAQLISGEHRIEIGMLEPDKNGVLTVRVSPLQLNMHSLDELEKRSEHNAVRRAFDLGRTKIETRADKMDALWQNDPDREARQRAVQESVAKRVFANANRQYQAQRAQQPPEAAAQAPEERRINEMRSPDVPESRGPETAPKAAETAPKQPVREKIALDEMENADVPKQRGRANSLPGTQKEREAAEKTQQELTDVEKNEKPARERVTLDELFSEEPQRARPRSRSLPTKPKTLTLGEDGKEKKGKDMGGK